MPNPYFNPGTGSVASICPSCGHGYEQPAHPDCRHPERHPQPTTTTTTQEDQ